MANYNTLREANIARNIEWTGNQSIEDFTWRGCELVGEVGEVAEVLTRHTPNAWNSKDELADELADSVICIDLTRMTLGLPEQTIFAQGSFTHVEREALRLLREVAAIANLIKKLERERRGWPGSRANLEDVDRMLQNLMGRLGLVAFYYSLDLNEATARKFNATSHKVGLVTRLIYGGEILT